MPLIKESCSKWYAMLGSLAEDQAEIAPGFLHLDADSIPFTQQDGCSIRLLVGTTYDLQSPIPAYQSMFFADVSFQQNKLTASPEPRA